MAKACAEFGSSKDNIKPNPNHLGESGEVITEIMCDEVGYTNFTDSSGKEIKFRGAKNGFDHVKYNEEDGSFIILDTKNLEDRNPVSCLSESRRRGVELTDAWIKETAVETARGKLDNLSRPKIHGGEEINDELADEYQRQNKIIAKMVLEELNTAREEKREPKITVLISHVDQETGSVNWLQKKDGVSDEDIKSNDSWKQVHYAEEDRFKNLDPHKYKIS